MKISVLSIQAIALGAVPLTNGLAIARAANVVDLKTVSYFSLPFALPPTGDLRWRAPVPIEKAPPTTELTDATKAGNICVQGGALFEQSASIDPQTAAALNITAPAEKPVEGEDCLRLDITVPQKPKSRSLPVVVAIHGGGYSGGSSGGFPGQSFTQYTEGSVVFVSIQYRLGAYGFLGGSAIKKDGAPNAGILDQRSALEWVQRNIAAFGGDKEYPGIIPYKSDKSLEGQFQELLSTSTCEDIACLRSLSFEALSNSTKQVYKLGLANGHYGTQQPYFGPYVDGTAILGIPSKEFAKGAWSKVPLITTHGAFEGTIFTDSAVSSEDGVRNMLSLVLQIDKSNAFINDAIRKYPWIKFIGSYFDKPFFNSQVYTLLSIVLKWSKLNTSFWQAQTMAAAAAGVPSWKLYFQASPYVHGASSFYSVGDSSASMNPTLANTIKDYIVSFVLELDPNVWKKSPQQSKRPDWSRYTQASVLHIDDGSIKLKADPDANDVCDFWFLRSDISRI
ncbi:alpha/beta-hydrolase [Aaosphaeria arxii CBS 175.79]|uniref:Alpha/beta-hydrolase n=1 Tax=Aaosphaeria arxii CBS 175.79 TaxID=1450172 RepID=A0A6A5Y0S0_9PLEO|nr:alpha/beta-hydrolase [Aaosphaeria arxii CBS 175.79]KAF2018793.1 alpha/beta-hydrolase [Aaosphaeria arxii CBS 175.79]